MFWEVYGGLIPTDYLRDHPEIKLVRFVLFDSKTFDVYKESLKGIAAHR